ncbi:MAG: RNA polymerase sigma factor [Planctomycetes bacterium]|nr:RNA polymerase sigma factor [Planctomycetota bacterium]
MASTDQDPCDSATLLGARQGDRGALERLLMAVAGPVYRAAAARLGEGPDAEDAAQEALLRIARGIRGFRGQARLGTWAYRIALRTAADRQAARERAERRHRELARSARPGAGVRPEAELEREEDRSRVRAAVGELPPEQREVVVLRLWEGLGYPEVARVLGCPVPTVHSRMARALERLRGSLAPREGGP